MHKSFELLLCVSARVYIVLDVQIGHHFAKVRQSVVIRIRVDVREILAGVGLDEARIISA